MATVNLLKQLSIVTLSATLTLSVAARPSQAAQFNFSYSGSGVDASGILTTEDLDTTTNSYKIIGIRRKA